MKMVESLTIHNKLEEGKTYTMSQKKDFSFILRLKNNSEGFLQIIYELFVSQNNWQSNNVKQC